MKLSDARIRSLKPKPKLYRVGDGHGLWLEIVPTGAKYWRYRHSWNGRETMTSLGEYPEVGLAQARDRLVDARRALRAGARPDPIRPASPTALQAATAKRQFKAVAEAWRLEKQDGLATKTLAKIEAILEMDLIPVLGNEDIGMLATPQAAAAIEKIAKRAPHIAQKAKSYLNQIIDFAIRKGLREDGKTLTLKGMVKLPKAKGLPAAIETGSLRTVMQAIDAYPDRMVRSALLLTAFTALRPSNVVSVCWSYIDLQAGRIRFPAEAMKTGEAHEVPIPTQAIALLEEARIWARGDKYADLVFPTINGTKTDHLHRDTLSKALRESGLRDAHVPHGFRASLRTVAREEFGIEIDVLEAQLAHSVGDATQKAYNRAKLIKKRAEAMQLWADYLCGLMKVTESE